ncbi:MAG: helix-turn-helix transcriptional regulator [Paracoccaceae bacterium]
MDRMQRSPAELRSMFGANLRELSKSYPSISELSRQLGINRTQFNRYLSGESFPRPDVLSRICNFFEVDARILLEPVDNILAPTDILSGEFLKDFLGSAITEIHDQTFPSGFYRFSRRSFMDSSQFVIGLVRVWRQDGATYMRGLEARAAMQAQGLPVSRESREFRGVLILQEEGVAAVISRKGAATVSFNYLTRVASFKSNYWVGFVARSMREVSDTDRVVRMVYEYVGVDMRSAKEAARTVGYKNEEELPAFHRRLLQTDKGFS